MGIKSRIQNWLGISEAPRPSGGGGGSKRDPKQSVIKRLGLVINSGSGRDFQAPEFDLQSIQNAYNTEAYVRIALDKYIESMFKAGWEFVGKNPTTVEYIKQRFKLMAESTQIPTKQLFVEIAEDFVKYANSVVAKARQDGYPFPTGTTVQGISGMAPVVGYFPLSMLTVSVLRDNVGLVKGWQQQVSGSGSNKPVKFKPDDIIHFYYRRERGAAFGTPFLLPVLDDLRALRQAEEHVLRLIYRNLYPFHHVQVGTPDIPSDDTEVADVKAEIEAMELEAGLITSERVKINPVASNQIIDAQPYLKYFEQRAFTGLGVPETMMGRGGAANRATSDNMTTDFVDRCKAFQAVMAVFVNEFMIKELLMEGGFDPILNPDDDVQFNFLEIDLDAQIKFENQAVYLYEHNSITQDEMRMRLSLDPVTDQNLMFLNMVSIPLAQAQAAARAAAAGTGSSTAPSAKPNAPKPKTRPGSKSPSKPKPKSSYELELETAFYELAETMKNLVVKYYEADSRPSEQLAVLNQFTEATQVVEQIFLSTTYQYQGVISEKNGIVFRRLCSQVHDGIVTVLPELKGSNRVNQAQETVDALFRVLSSRLTDIADEFNQEEVEGVE